MYHEGALLLWQAVLRICTSRWRAWLASLRSREWRDGDVASKVETRRGGSWTWCEASASSDPPITVADVDAWIRHGTLRLRLPSRLPPHWCCRPTAELEALGVGAAAFGTSRVGTLISQRATTRIRDAG